MFGSTVSFFIINILALNHWWAGKCGHGLGSLSGSVSVSLTHSLFLTHTHTHTPTEIHQVIQIHPTKSSKHHQMELGNQHRITKRWSEIWWQLLPAVCMSSCRIPALASCRWDHHDTIYQRPAVHLPVTLFNIQPPCSVFRVILS